MVQCGFGLEFVERDLFTVPGFYFFALHVCKYLFFGKCFGNWIVPQQKRQDKKYNYVGTDGCVSAAFFGTETINVALGRMAFADCDRHTFYLGIQVYKFKTEINLYTIYYFCLVGSNIKILQTNKIEIIVLKEALVELDKPNILK